MYRYRSREYPTDGPIVHNRVEPGDGIVGCEMHDRNGWGEDFAFVPKPKGGLLRLIRDLFRRELER